MDVTKIYREEMEWGGRTLSIETGRMARQADGAVLVKWGETQVLCTVVAARKLEAGLSFFPLNVHYLEKTYAVGRIPAGFVKRETKPSDDEALKSRSIDRPLRPLFPEAFFHEVQIICTVLSYDYQSDLEVVATIGASAALNLSGIPFNGSVAASRVLIKNGSIQVIPCVEHYHEADANILMAGTKDGVLMVESHGKEVDEDLFLKAIEAGHEAYQDVLSMVDALIKKAGRKKPLFASNEHEIQALIKDIHGVFAKDIKKTFKLPTKQERYLEREELFDARVKAEFIDRVRDKIYLRHAFDAVVSDLMRKDILAKDKRIDGRAHDAIRPIVCEHNVLPRTHGSSLFTRGETQVLAVTTLGTAQDEQVVETLDGEYRESFMLHYNFPSFSVNEVQRLGPPARREIGHGRLAYNAIYPLAPKRHEFPYTVRTVAEVTESNGSSSMAAVCASSLALMDAGVPLKAPLAGIAMGLIKDNKKYKILSDISGDEDALGDMDLKVAGTSKGITALQMDVKMQSLSLDVLREALDQAKKGRIHILSIMNEVLSFAKTTVSKHAPKRESIKIPREKIRDIIGQGGKTIRELCDTTATKIDVEDDGTVIISSPHQDAIERAKKAIKMILTPSIVGDVVDGKVVSIMDYGVFINISPGKDGFLHISEIQDGPLDHPSSVMSVGQSMKVKILGFDRGKVQLSIKGLE
jgi:polyribonucleotide nucleotidyltransferase